MRVGRGEGRKGVQRGLTSRQASTATPPPASPIETNKEQGTHLALARNTLTRQELGLGVRLGSLHDAHLQAAGVGGGGWMSWHGAAWLTACAAATAVGSTPGKALAGTARLCARPYNLLSPPPHLSPIPR